MGFAGAKKPKVHREGYEGGGTSGMARKSKQIKSPKRPKRVGPVQSSKAAGIHSEKPQDPLTQSDPGRRARRANNWEQGVWLPAMASAVLLWAAYPPLGLGLLAWIAPVGWLLIANRKLPVGRRGYWILWLSGCVFWLPILHGIRLGFWPLVFGWIALSLYLAIYVPVFVGLTRVLRWQLHAPLVLAAPTVWLGLELIRSYLITGYAANTLGHSQVHFPLVIQIADQLGGSGISFVVMSVSVGLLIACTTAMRRKPLVPRGSAEVASMAWSLLLIMGTLAYGWWRLRESDQQQAADEPLLRVLLVQENTPSIFDVFSRERNQQAWDSYLELTRKAAAEFAPIDLVVWPESTFTANEPWVEATLSNGVPEELEREQVDAARLLAWADNMQQAFAYKVGLLIAATTIHERDSRAATVPLLQTSHQQTADTTPHFLLGSDAWIYTSQADRHYNTALLVGPDGKLVDRYDKMHLVMFGEYIPLGPILSWLRDWVGLKTQAGTEVKSFDVGSVQVAPSICFESMMPRLISWQVRKLTREGRSPEVLINITNDSWFRGSSMLDHHLACSILCAVENRRPLLVAANTGLTAEIDGSGRLLQCTHRGSSQALLAEPRADGRWGLVQLCGYPFSWLAALVTLLAGVYPVVVARWRRKEAATEGGPGPTSDR